MTGKNTSEQDKKMWEAKRAYVENARSTFTDINHLQWYKKEKLDQIRSGKLKQLVGWHLHNNPWFADRIKGITPQDVSVGQMHNLPVTSRQDIITAGEEFFAKKVPDSHGKPGSVKSSGSTGEPVEVRATNITSMFLHALNAQEHQWHRRDPKDRLIVIKAGIFENKESPHYDTPLIRDTGPCYALNIYTDVTEQAKIIQEFKPDSMVLYPSNLDALMDFWVENNSVPILKHIKSIGETLSTRIREKAWRILKIKIEDCYSSQELGSIANQCEAGMYHTADPNLIVEVLDENDKPVGVGEQGRVVVTDVHNYASPMIRYDTGDWAVRGGDCKCGRSWQTLTKVLGRTRNLMKFPDGRRYWPRVGMYEFDQLSFRIRRYQIIQHTVTDIEYKVQVDQLLTDSQKQELVTIAQAAMGTEFNITVKDQTTPWPQAPNGKHEEFICKA
jgi:phenylacetate-CoA ligase